jgi:CTP:phosphocholine cytidylyltransferase-like protein
LDVKLELYLYLNDKFVWLKDKLELYLYLNDKFQKIRMNLWSI